MPTEAAEAAESVAESPHNPEAEYANGGSPAVNEMANKFFSGMGDNWNRENANPPTEKPAVVDKTPADEKEKPELDKPEVAKVDAAKAAEAAKVEPAKADAPKPADAAVDPLTLELPRSASTKANENFAKVKEVAKAERMRAEKAEKLLKEAQTQIETVKKTGNVPADYEQLKKERDELSETLKIANVERHPKFKAYFEGKVNEATALAVSIAGPDNKAAVESALKMSDGPAKDAAIDDILSTLPQYKAVQLGAALAQFPAIQRERDAELAKAKDSWDKLESERTGQSQAQVKDREAKISALIAKAEAASAEFDGFKEIEGDTEHNTQVASRKAFIKDMFAGTVKPELVPMIPVMVGEYLHLKNNVLPKRDAQIAGIMKQLQELQVASPAPKGAGGVPAKEAAAGEQPVGFVQDFMSRMRGERT